MTTHVLTPKASDQVTGLQNPLLGWNFSGATFQDIFQGCTIIYWAGWRWRITEDDTQPVTYPQPPFWQMELNKPGFSTVVIRDTDWLAFDGHVVRKLGLEEVANFDVTQWGGPAALGGSGPDPQPDEPPAGTPLTGTATG